MNGGGQEAKVKEKGYDIAEPSPRNNENAQCLGRSFLTKQ